MITAKRARLCPEITSHMIFVQKNVQLMEEHWDEIMPNTPWTESYLPKPVADVDEEGNYIDVGQYDDDFD